MNPFDRCSFNHFCRASSSVRDRGYMGPKGGVKSSFRGMRWSYGQCGGSLFASPSENRGRNLWYSGGTMSVILGLFYSSFKALWISYSNIILTRSQFHLAYQMRGAGPIMAILIGVALVKRDSGGSSLVPRTVTAQSLQ
jgi:hypothetical protein